MNFIPRIFQQLFLILFIILFAGSCKNDLKEINALLKKENYPDVSVTNLESIYSKEAQINAKVISPLVNKYSRGEDPYYEFPQGIEVFFYGENLKIQSTLKSDYAIYYDKKQFGHAQKNVILKNAEGTTLTTDELFIDEKEEKIYTDKYVKIIETSGFIMEGENGFESNLNFTVYKFMDVAGVIPSENILSPDSLNRDTLK